MKEFYENYWKIRGKSGFRPRYEIFLNWIEPGSKVLELGCGDGYFGELLVKDKKVDYLGIDVSGEGLKIARERGLKVEKFDIQNGLERVSGKFDYVVMSEFLEHIINSEEILMHASKIAKKGVLLSIPNIAYWHYRIQLIFGKFPKQWVIAPYEHLRFWSVKDFLKTLENLNLRTKYIKSSNGKKILRDLFPNLFGFQICFYVKPFAK